MREQGVVLEHRVDRTFVGRKGADLFAEDLEAAFGRKLEAGDHPQRCCLPATGRSEHGEELAIGDLEIDRVDCDDVVKSFRHRTERYGRRPQFSHCHLVLFPHGDTIVASAVEFLQLGHRLGE